MSYRSQMLLLGAGLLSLSAIALAQPSAAPAGAPPADGPARFAPPANRAELKAELEKHFDKLDANHDGIVTPEERKTARDARRDEMREQMFSRLDTNKDGSISKSEFLAAAPPPRGPDGAGMPPPPGDHMGMPPPDGMAMGMPGPDGERRGKPGHGFKGRMGGKMMKHDLAGFDDKPITKKAFIDAGLSRFDRADTNHDGKISPAERDAARKAMRDRSAPANSPPPPPPGL